MRTFWALLLVHQSWAAMNMPPTSIFDPNKVQQCLPAVQQHIYCLKQEVRYYEETLNEEVTPDFMFRVGKCFTDHGCNEPNNLKSLDSYLGHKDLAYWNKFREFWDSLDTQKKHCALKAVGNDFRPKFVECIAQTVPGFQVPMLRDDVVLPEKTKATIRKIAEYRVNVAKAANNCSHLDEVDKCIYNLRRTQFSATCQVRQHCAVDDEDSSYSCYTVCLTLDPSCRDIINRIRDPACTCAAQGQKLLRSQVTKFEKSGKSLLDAFMFGNKLTQPLQQCGIAVPLNPVKEKNISSALPLLIAQYIDGFAERDVTFCHRCSPFQKI